MRGLGQRRRTSVSVFLAMLAAGLAAPHLAAQDQKGPARRLEAGFGVRDKAPPSSGPAEARAVLAARCARCHEASRTEGRAPAGNFGNVLALEEIANDPALVRPGLPDGSALYVRMLHGHKPLAPYQGATNGNGAPSAQEIAVVREWIASLGPRDEACAGRPLITPRQTVAQIEAWLKRAGAAAATTRFVTLAPFHNTCASDAEMAAYRQAVETLLNSLSRSAAPARFDAIGDELALLAFNLTDIGWRSADWERLARAHPPGSATPIPEALERTAGSILPVVRADWLAAAALSPKVYYRLTGFPSSLQELGPFAGFDPGAAEAGKVVRAGLRRSPLTGGARRLERRETGHGFLWLADDLPALKPSSEEDVWKALVPNGSGDALRPVRRRVLLTLPNGFPAAGLFDADGRRLGQSEGGNGLSAEPTFEPLTGGFSCLSCHGGGPLAVRDDVRPLAETDARLSQTQRDALLASYPPAAELSRLVGTDAARVRNALLGAGVDPDLKLHGLDLVTALARRYDRDLDLVHAARELGLESSDLLRRLESADGEARPLALRLAQGLLGRADLERLLTLLRAAGSGSGGQGAVEKLEDDGEETPKVRPALAVWAERLAYKVGDLAAFYVEAGTDCFLTLVDVDDAGRATVLFPNDLEPDNVLRANVSRRIPAAAAPYQLRFDRTGRENLVAICSSRAEPPLAMAHDFARQRFTVLGDWRKYLTTVSDRAREVRRLVDKVRRVRHRRLRARRPVEPKPEVRSGPELLLQSAIAVTVK